MLQLRGGCMSEDVNFRKKEYSELFYAYLKDAYNQGLLSDDSQFLNYIENREDIESNYIMQASVHNKTLETAYKDMGLIYNALSVDSANGSDLDNLGNILGIYRRPATPYLIEVLFEIKNPSNTNITIPSETIITTRSGNMSKAYYTPEDAVIIAGSNYVLTSALSLETDAIAKVGIGEIQHISSNLNLTNPVSVRNTTVSTSGKAVESDEDYRSRILNWTYTLKRGTIDSYLDYLDSVPGLLAYNFIPEWDGAGTIKIIIDPGTNYLITKVYNGLITNVCNADEDLTVVAAQEKLIDLNLGVNVSIDNPTEYTSSEKVEIKNIIENLIRIYIDGGDALKFVELGDGTYQLETIDYPGLMIGENFIPSQCTTFINKQLDLQGNNIVKNIEFKIPKSFLASSDTDYYGNISDEEVATTGNITLTIK